MRQTDVGVSNGSGTFPLSRSPTDSQQVRVWASGYRRAPVTEFAVNGQNVVFVAGSEPPQGDSIIVDYPV